MTILQLNQKKNFGQNSTKQQDRVYDPNGIMAALSNSRLESKVTIRLKPRGFQKGNESDIAPTITRKSFEHNAFLSDNDTYRRLTEIECERLQGFPDNWTAYGNYNGVIKQIPKTVRYALLGNSLTVKLVELIGKRLLNNLAKT